MSQYDTSEMFEGNKKHFMVGVPNQVVIAPV